MRPKASQPVPFDTDLDPALAALCAACDGTRDIHALTAVVRGVDPAADETAVWAMLDDLAALGCLEQAVAPPTERGFSRRSWLRGMTLGAAAAATVVAARPARAQSTDDLFGDVLAEEAAGGEGTVCSYRSITLAGRREQDQKRIRSQASEQEEKAARRYEEERAKADAVGDRQLAEEKHKGYQAERRAIREEAEKAADRKAPATVKEQESKAEHKRKDQTRVWRSEPGVGRAPGFLDLGAYGVLEGEVDVLRTAFFEKDGTCGGLTASFLFRSRRGEAGSDPEGLAARSFPEIAGAIRSATMKPGADGTLPEVTLAWGLSEGLAWTGRVSSARLAYTAWDEAGEPAEASVRLELV